MDRTTPPTEARSTAGWFCRAVRGKGLASLLQTPSRVTRSIWRYAKWLLLGLLLTLIASGAYILHALAHDNFHVVSDGRVYRSGQMSARTLADTIQRRGIRSVVNLRGASPRDDWYRAETNTTGQFGVQRLDYGLSAGREVSDSEIQSIMEFLRRAPKPVLIHCQGGADRTGLISAIYLYTIEGNTPNVADRELTVFYGHIPHLHWRYSVAMDHSFWRYVSNHTAQTELIPQPHPASP
jgi:protein tyrosine/serine phosphatase